MTGAGFGRVKTKFAVRLAEVLYFWRSTSGCFTPRSAPLQHATQEGEGLFGYVRGQVATDLAVRE
jgi:hypothetical protein